MPTDKEYIEVLTNQIANLQKIMPHYELQEKLTLGQRISDLCCSFLGNWACFWIVTIITGVWMYHHPFNDVFPYCLYTLVISVWALYGNTFIQMSNNRGIERDRWYAHLDAETNTRSELSLILLHKKMDLLLDYLNKKEN